MSKNIEQIHEFQFNQRLNILKGFKEVSGTAPLPIEELRKSLGDEPLYTTENLEKYTKDVLTKGNEDDIQKAKEVLNSLSCREVIDENGYVQNMYFYVEKGHMDFDGSSGGGGRQGLVKKQITDKTGRNTTKWVRANQDDKKEEKTPKADEGAESKDKKPEVSSEQDSEQKESLINRELSSGEYASHAASTDSEDLKAFIQKNPDAPGAAEAKAELQKRGELDSEDEGGIDFNDPESVKNALSAHPDKEAIIDSAIENGITPAQALKMHESNKTDHSETHAAIDGAQAALDALKEKTGHPGVGQENVLDNNQEQLLKESWGGEGNYEDSDDFLDHVRSNDEDGDFEDLSDDDIKSWFDRNENSNMGDKTDEGSMKSAVLNEDMSDHYEAFDGDFDAFEEEIRDRFNAPEGEDDEIDDLIAEASLYFADQNSKGGDQSSEEPGKTTEDTKDLVNEHKDLVDTLESEDKEDDKEELGKQKKELKDLEKEQDNDGHDDDGDGKDEDDTDSDDDKLAEKVTKDLTDTFDKLDELVGDDDFNIMDAQDPDSDYSKVLNYVADMIEKYHIDEDSFNEVARKFKGLDLVYSDFSKD